MHVTGHLCLRIHAYIHARVCECTQVINQVRSLAGQISRGQSESKCMLGAGLCSFCTLCQSRAVRRTREVEEEGGKPCGKTTQEEEEDTQQAAREQY